MAKHPTSWRYLTERDLGMDKKSIKESFASHIEYTQGKDEHSVTRLDFFEGLARSARDRMLDRWNRTQQRYYDEKAKRIYYLSVEFLIGRLLSDTLNNLGIADEARKALAELDIDVDDILEMEQDAGLGNGGLGRLAACFLDSMATLGLPAMGYGIRYEYGIFRQRVESGCQVEVPDNWLRYGCPWEIPRPETLYIVRFGGRVAVRKDDRGREIFEWVDTENVVAMAYDVPVPGYRNDVVNTLRLWAAKASREFDFANFNRGDYFQAVENKNASENISRVLYPNDKFIEGRALRLKQEHFFVSATLQDAILRHLKMHPSLSNLADKAVFQLNDTHPAMAVAELMRLLIDEHGFGWDEAWRITRGAFAYTNHTIMPEALEQWRVALLERLLPRHLQIIYELNYRFLEEVRGRFPGDDERVRRMSLIDETGERRVRMANLAILGSRSVNGVSALHSDIVKEHLFHDFFEMYPARFSNKTNGITPRRWLLTCNPNLAGIIAGRIGDGWVRDLDGLAALAGDCDNKKLQAAWRKAKWQNKVRLAARIMDATQVAVDPDSLFDVQVKRIHEYKRQLLNVLHALKLYRDLKLGRRPDRVPRTIIFAGKAAPGYDMAKRIIQLIHAVGQRINNDPDVAGRLKVVFVPNYCVSLAELIIPAADLSQQISTAGMEASGTGNMKLALNGALTIGTMDGANIEIREAVGDDNIFIFGLRADEVLAGKREGYNPRAVFENDVEIREILHMIAAGDLMPDQRFAFWPVVDALLDGGDPYMVLADFASYCACQERVDEAFRDGARWTRMSILNTARMGRFSSDRTIREYTEEIWGVPVRGPKK